MRQTLLALVIHLVLFSPAFSQDRTTEIIIISTNDVHGRIDNFSKMAAYVNGLKKTHKDVFVFNAGDLFNGNPVVDEAPEKGAPIFDLMNSIPYSISCLGNHEFENGETILQQRINQSTSVYVCANMELTVTSTLQPLKPYHIFHTSDGTSIAVLGLTANSSNPCLVKNINMVSPVKAALQYQSLKDSANIFMALTHIGYKADSTLASQLKGLDVIIGGHSHTEIPHGIIINGTLITQAGDKMRYFGKTVLTIREHKIINRSFEMVDVASLQEKDATVQAKIDGYNANPLFKKTVGMAISDFTDKEAIGCLKTDALREVLKLDIAFDHVRNISWSNFPKGKITFRDIYEWDSYDYKTLRYELIPAQMRQLIKNSLKNAESPVLFVSGITYTIVKDAGGGISNIIIKNSNGLLDENKTYSVGMNSFIACQFIKDINATGSELSTTSAEALITYFKMHPRVNYANSKRVFTQ